MKTRIVIGTAGLLLFASLASVTAVHISNDGDPNVQDPVLSLLTGTTVNTNDWWAGNTVDSCNAAGGVLCQQITVSTCFNAFPGQSINSVTPTGSTTRRIIHQTICSIAGTTTTVNTAFQVGVVICEQEALTGPGPHAGFGGRCFSSADPDPGPPAANDDWYVMEVWQDFNSNGCNPAWNGLATGGPPVTDRFSTNSAAYFARIGGTVNGVDVQAGQFFAYSHLAAWWITKGIMHITYFIDTTSNPNNLDCFGHDEHWTIATTGQIDASYADCNDSTGAPTNLLDKVCAISRT